MIENQNIVYTETNALKHLHDTFNLRSIQHLKENNKVNPAILKCIKKNAKEGYLLDILLLEMVKQSNL